MNEEKYQILTKSCNRLLHEIREIELHHGTNHSEWNKIIYKKRLEVAFIECWMKEYEPELVY